MYIYMSMYIYICVYIYTQLGAAARLGPSLRRRAGRGNYVRCARLLLLRLRNIHI